MTILKKRRSPSTDKPKSSTVVGSRMLDAEIAYITSDKTEEAIAQQFNLKFVEVRQRSIAGQWVKKRDDWREQVRKQAEEEAKDEVHSRRRKLRERISNVINKNLDHLEDNATGDIRSLERLVRLAMDLDSPGWDKSENDKGTGDVNVTVHIEEMIAAEEKERKHVIDTAGEVTSRDTMDQGTADFLFPQQKDEADDDDS